MLPVSEILPELCQHLQQGSRVVLAAPPGAGKSTYLPLYLLQQPQFATSRIVMLEPRRIAARAIAEYLARQLGETVGQTVGYQIRQERQYSQATRLLIVTEGILTRKIQNDPELSTVDLLIFDEFHERSLHADLGLALALEVQQLNDNLKILVMSATLDTAVLAQYLDAPVVQSQGRSYPVAIYHHPLDRNAIALQCARLAMQAWQQHQSSVLVFLPGSAEINQAYQWLVAQSLPAHVQVMPLLGAMSLVEQQRVIAAVPAGQIKLVLATNLAETSLTIEGINVVVDSGLARRASYQPRSGISRLDTVAISQAAATQRAGRAGRLAAGHCYRLDSIEQWQRRAAFEPAEVEIAELTSLRLELAVWGCQPHDLAWLTAPAAPNLAAATALLQQLQVLDASGQLTREGRARYALGIDIRLACMIAHAQVLAVESPSILWLAILLAALLDDNRLTNDDLYRQLQRLQRADPALSKVFQHAKRLAKRLQCEPQAQLPLAWLPVLLLRAYPDRLAQRRGQGYLLANGIGANLRHDHPLQQQPYLVVVTMQQFQQQNRIQHAIAINIEDVLVDWPALSWQTKTYWDDKQAGLYSEQQRCFGELVLQRRPTALQLNGEQIQQAWLAYITKHGLAVLPFTERALQLQHRLRVLAQAEINHFPDLSATALLQRLAEWLGPYLHNLTKASQLTQLPIYDLLWQQLSFQQQQQLQQWLPEFWHTPTGTRVAIDYSLSSGPGFSVRVQEMYGQLVSPCVLNGQIPLTLTLLSPGKQPLQITRDLASFWQHSWLEVKKEMKGRYPKHYWPDDPAQAQPTNRTKKAMQLYEPK